jgi:hypothetical protein
MAVRRAIKPLPLGKNSGDSMPHVSPRALPPGGGSRAAPPGGGGAHVGRRALPPCGDGGSMLHVGLRARQQQLLPRKFLLAAALGEKSLLAAALGENGSGRCSRRPAAHGSCSSVLVFL